MQQLYYIRYSKKFTYGSQGTKGCMLVINNITSLYVKDFRINRSAYVGDPKINPSWKLRNEYIYTHTHIHTHKHKERGHTHINTTSNFS